MRKKHNAHKYFRTSGEVTEIELADGRLEAAEAYDKEASRTQGMFAVTNFGSYHTEGLWKSGREESNATLDIASTVETRSNPSIDMIIDRVRAGL